MQQQRENPFSPFHLIRRFVKLIVIWIVMVTIYRTAFGNPKRDQFEREYQQRIIMQRQMELQRSQLTNDELRDHFLNQMLTQSMPTPN